MKLVADWRFVLTAVAGVAGVLIPVWLWRADLNSRSVRVDLISQTSLQPDTKGATPGLSVVLDGTPLLAPHLTVFRLTNDGSRPIQASDFEGPIELLAKEPAKLVRVSVTSVLPTGLTPRLLTTGNTSSLQPLLLNPGDAITIAAISSEAPPQFVARARIAGVPDVAIDSSAKSEKSRQVGLIGLALGFLSLTASFITADTSRDGVVRIRQRAATFSSLVAGLVGVACVAVFGISREIESVWQVIGIGALVCVPAAIMGHILNKPRSQPAAGSANAP